jgi:aspartate aminotransferase-like enzyme
MLDESLQLIRREGMEQVWARHRRLGAAFRAAAAAMGLTPVSRAPADTLTALWLPVSWRELDTRLRDEENLVVAGGQGKFAGKVMRIAHMGYTQINDLAAAAAGLARALSTCGHTADPARAEAAVRHEAGRPADT